MIKLLNLKPYINKNILILFGGASLSQLLLFLVTPILSRLYTPSEFGLYGSFVAVTSVISVVACLRYELALPLVEKAKKKLAVVCISMLVLAVSTLAVLGGLVLIDFVWKPALFQNPLGSHIYVIPLGVALMSAYSICSYYFISEKSFKAISVSKITQTLGLVCGQLVLWKFGLMGLVLGSLGGLLASLLYSIPKVIEGLSFRSSAVSRGELVATAKEFRSLPAYSTLGALLNSAGNNLPVILVALMYGSTAGGVFYLALKVINAPLQFVGTAFGQVFYAEAPQSYRIKALNQLVRKTSGKLFLLSLVPFFLAFLFGKEVIPFIFGDGWSKSGEIFSLLTLVAFFQLITSPVSQTLLVLSKEKLNSALQLLLLVLKVFGLGVGYKYGGMYESVWLYSLFGAIGYLVFLGACLLLSDRSDSSE